MNRYRTHVLIAISILTAIITLPTYASIVSEEACPDCEESMTLEEIQQMRLSEVPIRMWTDRSIYEYGSSIQVEGVVASIKEGMPVTIKVTSPTGNVVNIAQVDVEDDRTFQTILNTAGELWKQNGMYTVRAQYGPQEINDKVLVEMVGGPAMDEIVSHCSANELTVRSSTDAYCVQFLAQDVTVTKATVSASSFSIAMNVKADSDGSLTLTIPRSVLDSTSNEGDSPFIVLIDDGEGFAFEVASSGTTRTLEIMVPEGASKIEIIGTFAIPEFGTMAAIILGVAIVSIIVVSARSRLIMPKY